MGTLQFAEKANYDLTDCEDLILGKTVIDKTGKPCGTVIGAMMEDDGLLQVDIEWRSFLGWRRHRLVPETVILDLQDNEIKLAISDKDLKTQAWKIVDREPREWTEAEYHYGCDVDERRNRPYFIL